MKLFNGRVLVLLVLFCVLLILLFFNDLIENNVTPIVPSLISGIITLFQKKKINNNGKCLVIIFGQTRASSLTWTSFEKYLLNSTKCDLALCVGTRLENTTNPYYLHAKYVWIWDETSDKWAWNSTVFRGSESHDAMFWEKSLDFLFDLSVKHYPNKFRNILKDDWKILFEIPDQWIGPVANQAGSAGILLFFRQFAYFKIKELNLMDKYQYFMYTRSDYKYRCKFPMNIITNNRTEMNKLWVTSAYWWDGITDRNLLTSNHLFLDTLDVFLDMFINYKLWHKVLNKWRDHHNGAPLNLERILKQHFVFKQIWSNVTKYHNIQFTVRDNDTWTRWSTGMIYDKEQKLYIKYKDEYNVAVKVCNGKWSLFPGQEGKMTTHKLFSNMTFNSSTAHRMIKSNNSTSDQQRL